MPRGYTDVDTVTDRVTRVLSGRPLLALDSDDEMIIRAEMPALQREVEDRTDDMMGSLRAQLE